MQRIAMVTIVALVALGMMMPAAARASQQDAASLLVDRSERPAVVRSARRDVVDSERFSTNENETLEILLADGTSVTLAAGSSVTIDRYRYDRSARLGELELTLNAGVIRLMGGALNNTNAIRVSVPGGTAMIDNGIAFVELDDGEASISLVLGREVAVQSAKGTLRTQTAGERLLISPDGTLSGPSKVTDVENQRLARLFNPGLATGEVPVFVADSETVEDELVAGADDSEKAREAREFTDVAAPVPFPPAFAGGFLANAFSVESSDNTAGAGQGNGGSDAGTGWIYTLSQDRLPDGSEGPGARYLIPDEGNNAAVSRNTTNVIFGAGTFSQNLTGASTDTSDQPIRLSDTMQFVLSGFDPKTGNDRNLAGPYLLLVSSIARPPPMVSDPNWENREIDPEGPGPVCLYRCTTTEPSGLVGRRPDFNDQGVSWQLAFDLSSTDVTNTNEVQSLVIASDLIAAGNDGQEDELGNPITPIKEPGTALNEAGQAFLGLFVGFRACDKYDGCDGEINGADPITITDPIGLTRDDNYFLLVDGRLCSDGSDSCATGDVRRFLFATGGVTGRTASDTGFSVDEFLLSDGLEGYRDGDTPGDPELSLATRQAVTDALRRAFVRPGVSELALDGQLVHLPLYVINSPGGNAALSRLLHADFAASVDGTTINQSTISVTIGTLQYLADGAQVFARTVGSTRDEIGLGSLAVQSAVFSSVVGGGNPNVEEGRAGYLVLENFDPAGDGRFDGGDEREIGGSSERFAILRLGAAQGTLNGADGTVTGADFNSDNAESAFASRTSSNWTGFVGGLMEAPSGSANPAVTVSSVYDGTVDFELDPTASTVAGTVTLPGTPQNQVSVGGEAGYSAFLDDHRFAALTSSDEDAAAIVTVSTLLGPRRTASGTPFDELRPANDAIPNVNGYEHLQWGFFFGDVGSRHAHMMPWVAARELANDNSELPSGSATYDGHAVGNVWHNGDTYTSLGTFSNTWNFSSRTGNGLMSLDGIDYTLATASNEPNSPTFGGSISQGTDPSVGRLDGEFAAGGVAMLGSFGIQATRTDDNVTRPLDGVDPNYLVLGVFGAERRPGGP